MPNQPKDPARTIRVPTELWEAARRKAERQGENLSEVIRRYLRRYVSK